MISLPAFAVPGYENFKVPEYGTNRYDVSDLEEKMEQLRDNYYRKYRGPKRTWVDEDGVECSEAVINAPMGAYQREVETPFFEYMKQTQSTRYDRKVKPAPKPH